MFSILPIACLAQLQPQKNDPLTKLQPPQGAAACSATELSSCAEAAAKILPQYWAIRRWRKTCGG